MEKFSVRRPFTVLVAVLIVIILGFVSVSNMTTDLLPSMSLPYMIVVTPYPGASPERVETAVSEPMERALGTISHVKNVYSVSSENYSMTQLEFEDGTDMDSAMVKVSSAVEQTRATLPDGCGTPSILEISMDMVATMYLAVGREGYDIYELSDYVKNDVVPYFERQEGVAEVSTIGLVEKSVQVELNDAKITDVNDRILALTDDGLRKALEELEDAKAQVERGQNELESQEKSFGETVSGGIMDGIEPEAEELAVQLKDGIDKLIGRLEELKDMSGSLGSVGDSMAGNISGAMQDFQDAYGTAVVDIGKIKADLEKAREQIEKIYGEGSTQAEAARKAINNVSEKAEAAKQATGQVEKDANDPAVQEAVEKAIEEAIEEAEKIIHDITEETEPGTGGGSQDGSGTGGQDGSSSGQGGTTDGSSTGGQDGSSSGDTGSGADSAGGTGEGAAPDSGASVPADGAEGTGSDASGIDGTTTGQAILPWNAAIQVRTSARVKSFHEILREVDDATPAEGGGTSGGGEGSGSGEGGSGEQSSARDSEEFKRLENDIQKLEQAGKDLEKALEGAATSTGSAIGYASSDELAERIQSMVKNLQGVSSTLQNSKSVSSISAGVSKLIAVTVSIEDMMDRLRASNISGEMNGGVDKIEEQLQNLLKDMDRYPELLDGLEEGMAKLTQGQLDAAVGFASAAMGLSSAQQQLEVATKQYERAREEALKNANLDQLVNAQTLSGLIYAQNFSMPAGYIDDKNDQSWLLKIGDEYGSEFEIADALLCEIEDLGVVRLSDVADVTVIDNADDSYTVLDGSDGVILAVYKSSTAGTNEVSAACNRAIEQLTETREGTHVVTLMDQGEYINMIVKDILTSMGLGALLAILVLALFLRDIRPTLMVGISIPLSVLFTVLLMYFSGLSLNIMTLSGLSLGIGMLVDNSIVVMENIIRLRQRGVSTARACVQGAKQVSNSIIASTLTTICVFLPMVFTTGTVRELLIPMALSITYCLTASLIVAMTVIPASASVILKNVKQKKESLFDRMLDRYGVALDYCLKHKAVPLGIASGLLAISVIWLIRMGVIMLPPMSSDYIEANVQTNEDLSKEESYALMDEAIGRMMQVENLADVGAMDLSSAAGLISSMQISGDNYGSYTLYITLTEGASKKDVERVQKEIEGILEPMDCEYSVSTGGMSDLSSFMSSGLSANVYGNDLERVTQITEDVMQAAAGIEGFEHISNGTENDEQTLHLVIDKDKAMSYGLTVAQIYSQIAARLNTEVESTTITADGLTLTVSIVDETDVLTRENLLDMEFTAQQSGASGMGGMSSAGMSGMSAGMGFGSAGGGMSLSGSSDLGGLAEMLGIETEESSEEETEEKAEEEKEEDDGVHKLSEFAHLEETTAPGSVQRENQSRYMTVTADTKEGFNTTLLTRQLQKEIDRINAELPDGYSVEIGGEALQVRQMVEQMAKMLALAFAFIYLVMVSQFQSLLSPFIILFTIPLAFTGGMIGLIVNRQQLSLLALMGFLVLMGTVVNNGIVFVDYTNQLRIGGLRRRNALIATGKTRMRPILMTTLTTVLAMMNLIFGSGMGSQLSRGMAIVISWGLMYATLMTLFIVPVVYDILYKKQPMNVEIGSDIDDIPDDAAQFMEEMAQQKEKRAEETGDETAAYREETPELREEAPELRGETEADPADDDMDVFDL